VDLFDVIKGCLRRWYVMLPVLIGTVWFCHHKYAEVRPVYYSSAVVGLAAPNTQFVQAPPDQIQVPHNGLLDIGGASLISNLLVLELRDPTVGAQVTAAGGSYYTVRMFPVPPTQPDLPLVMIESTEPIPAASEKTVSTVVAQVEPILRNIQLQAGVPEGQMVKALVVSPPSPPLVGIPSRTQSTVVIAVGGAGISVLLALVVDVFMLRRKVRKAKARGPGDNPDSTTSTQLPDRAIEPSVDGATEPRREDESIVGDQKKERQ
jgi:hypothetical protein